MNRDELPRQLVWSLTLLGVVCGLVESRKDERGDRQQLLDLTDLGANVPVDLVDRRPDLPRDHFLMLGVRPIACLAGVLVRSG